ncbi:hypothetical protein EYF80_013465 [Liparis tanakae]|uniref:Uncharacterized protein n=1 Tax=Liparis tanakae TaxID=230148 RepID=A0A4Z2IEN2_9TELE|nr:hypothetical protein EYF80_013465 [Liparis tanakae]
MAGSACRNWPDRKASLWAYMHGAGTRMVPGQFQYIWHILGWRNRLNTTRKNSRKSASSSSPQGRHCCSSKSQHRLRGHTTAMETATSQITQLVELHMFFYNYDTWYNNDQ